MTPFLVLTIYCVFIVLSSLLGGWIPSIVDLTHVRMQLVLSLVGGFMLGVALLHMIPHGVAACGDLDLVVGFALIGLIFTFLMIRILHFHQHGPAAHEDHSHVHDTCGHHSHAHPVSWLGVAFGLGLHTVMDGMAVGAAVVTEVGHGHSLFPGLAVFLAVLLHKPLDSLSIVSVMASGGLTKPIRMWINLGVAAMCPMGVVIVAVLIGLKGPEVSSNLDGRWLGVLLGLSAGVFLCISLSDLLPEVQFHSHDRFRLSAALLLGVALAYGVGFLEHSHDHSHPQMTNQIERTTDSAMSKAP